MSSRLQAIEAEAQLYGIVKQHGINQNRRVEWKVTCRGKDCPTPPLMLHWGPNIPPEMMVKDVRRKDWLIDRGDRPMCPACQGAVAKKARDLDKPKPRPVMPKLSPAEVEAAISGPFVSIPFTNTPKIKEPSMTITSEEKPQPKASISRQVYGMLEDNLDEKARCYLNGYSDQRVADEVGCAVGVVQDIRLSAFCELVEDQRLTILRGDITALEKALAKVTKTAAEDIAALRSRVEQIALTTKLR